jgi:hypothetical protein
VATSKVILYGEIVQDEAVEQVYVRVAEVA